MMITETETKLSVFSNISQVSLLVVMEIGLFPLICGWWLDICSLVSQSCRVNLMDHSHLLTKQLRCNHDYTGCTEFNKKLDEYEIWGKKHKHLNIKILESVLPKITVFGRGVENPDNMACPLLIAGDVWCNSERQGAEFWLCPRYHHVPPLAGRHGLCLLLRLFHSSVKRGKMGDISHSQPCIVTDVKPHTPSVAFKISCYCMFVWLQVLRPGVLWFLRNLNDPDFNPVQEMIHLPIYRHLRRFILSVVSHVSSSSILSQT